MKFAPRFLLAAAVLTTLAGSARAQVLTSGVLALDGSSVINLGPVQYAYNLDYGANNTTLNGPLFPVTFTGINPFATTSPNFSLSGTSGMDGTNNKNGNPADPLVSGDPLYLLQENGAYYALTLTLQNLNVGEKYAVQLTIGEQPGDSRYQYYTDGAATSPTVYAHSGPQYILDTFTATGATETLQAHISGGDGAQLTGFALEQDIPEPSTCALMLGGLALLGVCVRRRAALVK